MLNLLTYFSPWLRKRGAEEGRWTEHHLHELKVLQALVEAFPNESDAELKVRIQAYVDEFGDPGLWTVDRFDHYLRPIWFPKERWKYIATFGPNLALCHHGLKKISHTLNTR